MKEKEKFDIYSMITNVIIEKLEKGIIPWHQPWDISENTPVNLLSKKPYRGANLWMLLGQHERPWYLTYNQIKSIGANLRAGSKSHVVLFWKMFNYTEETDAKITIKRIPMLRYYRVFNIKDVDNVDEKYFPEQPEPRLFEPIEACSNLVENWQEKPIIKHNSPNAYYSPTFDEVCMPKPTRFHSPEEYYSTLFHELIHSTGHKKRLDRHKNSNHGFGSADYSFEELVAEMGAAFLCGYTGIENKVIDNSSAYIKGWLSRLQNDKKLFFTAASKAEKAADYMIYSEVFSE